MSKVKILLAFLCIQLLVLSANAQMYEYESDKMVDMLNVIRSEKFDFILPQALRENDIDMWIQVMGTKNVEEGNLDPLRLDLGGNTGYFIFTDRGGDRIERVAFGNISEAVRESGAYDDIESRNLRDFVAERDPKRIAVNFSEWLAVADGISHTDYLKLVETLGDKYAKRIVSAENVITVFRSRRVISEIAFYAELCKKTIDVMEKAFDILDPGVTTLKDLARYLKHENLSAGYSSVLQFGLLGLFIQDADGNEHVSDDYTIQRGDLVHLDYGLIMMNYQTDIKRIAYVLKEGETALPPEYEKIWEQTLDVRKLFRKHVKVGRTAGETLKLLERKIAEAGYIYAEEDGLDVNADPEKTQVHLDFHCLGHSWGDESVGPRISPWATDRAHLKIPRNHFFVLEYMMHMPVPKWGKGKRIYLAYEDDAIVTDYGVEFLYPPIKKIRLIH